MNLLRSERFWVWMSVLGIVVAAAVRFYSAWCVQYIPLRDYGVVLLMAKHMAELGQFPVFYSGQAYMGSLEPVLSALLCKIFGTSEYAVCAGTALWSCSVPFLVYLLTRDAAGSRAGFFSVAYLIVSSDTLLHFSSQPRGGYMTMLMFGLLTVLMVNRFTALALGSGETSVHHLVWAGFFAGLGWWNNQMVIIYLMTALVVAVPAIRYMFRQGVIFWALAAFLLGSLPWWWWNITNDWASLSFTQSFGKGTTLEGLGYFFQILPRTLGLEPWPTGMNIARLVGLVILAGVFVLAAVRTAKQKSPRSIQFITMVSAVLMVVFMMGFYSQSHFSRIKVTRYLMPLIPAAAVMVGVAIDWILQQRKLVVAGFLLFVLVVPRAVILMPSMNDHMAENRHRYEATKEFADFVEKNTGGVVVGDFLYCWVSFATRERAVIADMPVESYVPYARKAALAPVQAFINNFHDLRSFLKATRASGKQAYAGEFLVDYDFRAPSRDWAYLPLDQIVSVLEEKSRQDIRPLVADGNLDTQWVTMLRKDEKATLEWRFKRPVKTTGLRVMGSGTEGLGSIRLEGLTVAGEWVTLVENMPLTGHFWSGPRLFYQGLDYFQECRFTPRNTGFTALRLTTSLERESWLRLPEIAILESAQVNLPAWSLEAPDQWIAPLRRNNVQRLYVPRWMAERLQPVLSSSMHVRASSYMSQSLQSVPKNDPMEAEPLRLDVRTGLIIESQDVPRTRQLLSTQSILWKEETLQNQTLFVIEALNPAEELEVYVPLYWTDCGLFASDGKQNRITRAYDLYQRASVEKNPDTRLKMLERTVWLAPEYVSAVDDYVAALRKQGREAEAVKQQARLSVYAQPAIKLPGNFEDKIHFAGVSIEPSNPKPGAQIAVTYYWQCQPRSVIDKWSVFVHFRSNGKIIFQDDHSLTHDIPVSEAKNQPFPLTFRSTRLVKIPETASGEIDFCIGLVNPLTLKQASLSSPHKMRRTSIVMPAAFKIIRLNEAERPL
ncbi:MAG: glycosyltransferase family 39 protein [bacterium]